MLIRLIDQIRLLVGQTATPLTLQKLTYLSLTHDPRIIQIDTCRAYTLGEHYFVEIDIVLPPLMNLREAHDIGESLQYKVEKLEWVERCFVHIDFNGHHLPEHAVGK